MMTCSGLFFERREVITTGTKIKSREKKQVTKVHLHLPFSILKRKEKEKNKPQVAGFFLLCQSFVGCDELASCLSFLV